VFALITSRFRARFGPIGLLLAPAVWVSGELGRQYVWDGFPWTLLGYSQVTVLPIAQLASVVGVYGLSGLLALTGTAAAYASISRDRSRWIVFGSSAAVIVLIAVWGSARLRA